MVSVSMSVWLPNLLGLPLSSTSESEVRVQKCDTCSFRIPNQNHPSQWLMRKILQTRCVVRHCHHHWPRCQEPWLWWHHSASRNWFNWWLMSFERLYKMICVLQIYKASICCHANNPQTGLHSGIAVFQAFRLAIKIVNLERRNGCTVLSKTIVRTGPVICIQLVIYVIIP